MDCNPGSRLLSLWLWYVETDSLATEYELKRLGEHKYSAVDNSWLDELCMKRWWEYAVTWCPMWLAPNLITLIGLIINLITVLVLSTFSYSATEPAFCTRTLSSVGWLLDGLSVTPPYMQVEGGMYIDAKDNDDVLYTSGLNNYRDT
ncbi:unnamed protein product [Haemonchus placei]|uniref:Neur_chan_LBD domain-containing protein n=1 Tax=Haemonchus placei TaxID=6290 RepID=A0A0N4WNT3_HAEPC|nr:unnamed protein product [Haemonchus placei]